MPLSDHNGKNSFNLNNKSFANRGASGGTPIYDITSSGGSGGNGAALAGAVIEWGQFGAFTVVRSFGLDTPVLYQRTAYVSGGSYNTDHHSFHFPLSSPIQDPIVNYKLDENEALQATNVFYHESDPTSELNSWTSSGSGGYSGYVSSGNITDIVIFNFSMPNSPANDKLFLTIF